MPFNRPTATGEIDETNSLVHTGFLIHPDDRLYKFWYHSDEGIIYWGNDKGKTDNMWKGKVNVVGKFDVCRKITLSEKST